MARWRRYDRSSSFVEDPDDGEREASDRPSKRDPKRKRKDPPPRPDGVWDNCYAGRHNLCAKRVLVNATLTWSDCHCSCHVKERA